MSKLNSFSEDPGLFAVTFERSDLPGLLGKKLTVPAETYALVYDESGGISVLKAGGETSEVQRGILVRDGLTMEVEVDAGRSEDGLPFSCTLELVFETRDQSLDLGQLEQSCLQDGEATVSMVGTHFLPYLQDALRFFTSERAGKTLAEKDQRGDLDEHLRKELQKPCFETGLKLSDVRHPKFASSEWDARRDANLQADAEAAAVERERGLQDLKKQLDRNAILADIELNDEADRNRKEKRLARYEELRSRMGDDDRKALIMMLDDDEQRAKLIRELIEKDMTPEQRATLKVSEMESAVEDRLSELQAKLANLTGGELQRGESDTTTRRVLCVVGKRVLAFDPKTNLHPEVPKEVYDTEDGSLGYLRSVRVETLGGEEYVLCGAQRGIYRINGDVQTEFLFPKDPEGKGGANAVAYFDGRIFATHSEIGLIAWPEKGGEGRLLCEAVLEGVGSVRGALVHRGMLYFSAGSEVFAIDLATGSETPTRFKGSDDSVTSFVVADGELVAGNRSGKLYRWQLDDPNSPESFGVIKHNPIFMLRHTQIAGQPYFAIGSKDFTVTVCEPKKDLFREYQAREEVRWVEAAGDFVFGVSRSGYKVFCWDVFRQTEPKLTIRVSDKVQDLFALQQEG